MVLKEFSVPANTVSDELLQLFITLLVKVTVHSDLRRLKGCPLAPVNSSCLNKKQKNIKIIKKRSIFLKISVISFLALLYSRPCSFDKLCSYSIALI